MINGYFTTNHRQIFASFGNNFWLNLKKSVTIFCNLLQSKITQAKDGFLYIHCKTLPKSYEMMEKLGEFCYHVAFA
ncbi:hypothetical protein B0181_10490 [Moraxella caviae]|uniref:Uncharacterized protein n=1 Tax=Moraxella caviae TaxID=34060 RepID=A0A1S9ZV03_9GAMM|nr:hypothetical protein B0181_10490 [Moraxella caviae]